MGNLPGFLIIGPPKCASTSLHHYLGQHPQVYVSQVKETNFFTHDYDKGLAFYATYFAAAGNAKAIGEATPSYFFLPFAINRIRHDLPAAKLIVILRNPVERAFSHWLMFKESGVEKMSFREAIDINLQQMQQYNFIGNDGAKLWDNRRYTTGDEKWVRIYIQPGLYAENLKRLYNEFDASQVKLVFLDDLKNNLQQTLKNVFAFLNVNENFTIPDTAAKNFYFNKKYFRLLQNVVGIKAAHNISGLMPSGIKNIFRQKQHAVKTVPTLSGADRLYAEAIFKEDMLQLEKLLHCNLDKWRTHTINEQAAVN